MNSGAKQYWCDRCDKWHPDYSGAKMLSETKPTGIAGEVIVTDPKTGGKKGKKPAQLGAVHPAALMEVAKVAGFGATKYERYNFLKGYAWSLSYDAMQRHLHAFWGGENNDPESGLSHLAHAAWHALTLLTFRMFRLGTDDRPPRMQVTPETSPD